MFHLRTTNMFPYLSGTYPRNELCLDCAVFECQNVIRKPFSFLFVFQFKTCEVFFLKHELACVRN